MKTALANFQFLSLKDAARQFLASLGYKSDRFIAEADSKPQAFLDLFGSCHPFDPAKALVSEWKSADFLFQLTDEELSHETSLFADTSVRAGLLKSYVFLAIELKGAEYARGKFSSITRQLNRLFPMPVMVFFRHQTRLTIAVINRRVNKLDENKDVLGKVTLISGIDFAKPHRGHLDILTSLAFYNLVHPQKKPIIDFDTLHAAWEQIFNVELLNERFYRELANWYFWALPQVTFPNDTKKDSEEKHQASSLIRLLTRLIFCWFLKEKNLIPEKLFHSIDLGNILKGFDPESETSSTYYQAILQNLFFATLNQRMGKDGNGKPYRRYITEEKYKGKNKEHGVTTLFRYPELFTQPDTAVDQFADIPFLNGGLFECLDREDPNDKNRMLRLDGFTTDGQRPHIPDRLFFDSGETTDLSAAYGDTKRKAEKVSGLITILNRYKFTIVENTPIDQEIALDPELLGKVFENLLASYNDETKTTARKQTGSFYTPRPIVDYMVDESLKAHLTRTLVEKGRMKEPDARAGLELLFAYTEKEHAFSPTEVATLIAAIDDLKILDPACGSGAFPMGVLHKLVYLLSKLDRENVDWEKLQIAKVQEITDTEERRRKLAEIASNFADNNDDYGRKLYLIENCLYGVDIQPIAIQITKLRFFISLVCDQKTNRDKAKNHGIRPLPNLETKFVAADTLIGLPISKDPLFIETFVAPIEKEMEALCHSHFTVQRRDQKIVLQERIKTLRLKLADTISKNLGGVDTAKAKHLVEWDAFDPQSAADFFDPQWMFGRSLAEGFDIVLGNPPYVGFRDMDKKLKERIKDRFVSTNGKFDLYVPFVERGINILRKNAILSFIMPSAFAKRDYGEALRRLIIKSCSIDQFIDFGHAQIFSAATNYTGILQISIRPPRPDHHFRYCYGSLESETTLIPQSRLTEGAWILLAPFEQRILEIIVASGKPLSSFASISEGVVTGLNDLYLVDSKTIDTKSSIFKPCLRGREIRRYFHEDPKEYLFYPYTDNGGKSDVMAENELFEKIPEFMFHLESHRELLYSRDYFAKSSKAWYELWNQRRMDNFETIKVVTPELAESSRFSLAHAGIYYGDTVCGIIPYNDAAAMSHVLVAILNSSVVQWYYKKATVPKANGFFIYKVMFLKDVPIPPPSKTQMVVFQGLVDLLQLDIAHPVSHGTAAFLEDLIDACVMECYFREHMAERDLLFLDTVASYLASYDSEASDEQQRDFLIQLHATFNAPNHPIRNRLLRLTAESPDLLAVIKAEGRV
jgi:adenine-specific DNA-methyltransferase